MSAMCLHTALEAVMNGNEDSDPEECAMEPLMIKLKDILRREL